MAVTRRGAGFQAAFMVNGARYRAQFNTAIAAEEWEADTRRAIQRGLPVPDPHPSTKPKRDGKYTTLGQVFEYTRDHVWSDAKSARDLIRNAKAVVEQFGPDTPVTEIARVEIDEFVLACKARRNSGATINRKLAALSRMLRTAVELGALTSKPPMPRQKEPQGRERYLERDEADAIVQTLRLWSRDREAVLVEFLLSTGCRIGEALSLEWKDIHPTHVTIVGEKAKSSKTRLVPIPPSLHTTLLMERGGIERQGKGPFEDITYHAFRHTFEKAVSHLGLEDVVIHTLRHTTASWLAIAGVDMNRIMKFMGHADIKTTMRYAKLSPNALDGLAGVIAGYGQQEGVAA